MKLEKTSTQITLNTNNHIKPIKAYGFSSRAKSKTVGDKY